MGNLSYDDIVHGTQAGMRDVLGAVQKLQSQIQQMGNVQKAVLQVAAVQQQLIMCNRQLQSLNERLDMLQKQVGGNGPDIEQRFAIMHQEMNDLRSRFSAVERFASDVSEYLRSHEG